LYTYVYFYCNSRDLYNRVLLAVNLSISYFVDLGNDGMRKTAVWRCTLRKWQQEGVQQSIGFPLPNLDSIKEDQILLPKKYVHHLGIRKNACTVFFSDCDSYAALEVQITCVLDQLEVDSRSLELHEMQIQWGKSFDECILMCNLLRPENKCNAIKYYQSPMKCFLLAVHINSTTTDAQQKSFSAIFIYGCSRGSYYLHEIKNYSTLVRGGTFISLQILNKTFIIERRPTADSIRSKIIGNHHKSCIADCIFTCHAMTGQSGCNAVIYNPKTRFCTLLEHETPTPPTTFSHHEVALMLLLHLTLPCDVKINSVVIKATHNMSYELISESRAAVDSEGVSGPSPEQPKRTSAKAFVHLYRYMEVCKISVIHSGKIENVTSIQIISNVRSINRCLHFCRPWLRQLSYCAIVYSRHNYKCELLKRNTERSNTRFVGNEQSLIELLNCYPDRQDERRNNPPPVRYYLKEIGKICVLEFYNATQLSGFYPTAILENVENIKSCIHACRLRNSSYICLAINYTMKKQCTLFRQDLRHKIYNVESQSLFAEILFCEEGTLVDEIFDF
ncbi:hypothetical protein T4A_7765, partial [Trichinella pseudospiralis]